MRVIIKVDQRWHFCANLEAALWDVGECIDAFLISGTKFLGSGQTLLYALFRQLLQKSLMLNTAGSIPYFSFFFCSFLVK